MKRTYEAPGHTTIVGVCTCGACRPRLRDEHGNVDFGFAWDAERGDYVPRDCEIAAARREERS